MRIFVSVKIGKELENKIIEWQKSRDDLKVRWLKPENLHITLIPPWETQNIEEVKNKLKSLPRGEQSELYGGEFDILFNKVSFGPKPEHPRLIWAEGKSPENFKKLRKNTEQILGVYNNHPDEYIHVTLARFDPRDFKKLKTRELNEQVDWKDKVKSVILYQSQTLPEGAKYTILEEIKI
ncbi:2'-5' RNA ligase [Candidatus Nomurabacteria bacterium RIFCSPLOWO2_01_FULL_42_20]|uniref:RNA 2',3'-cyclic phosphodiesterase n=1 Tax=Candidatus Nomurabacteria bacterium RIFCSPHIGHO2_01_FULL_42_16 TaxID=1801743 RepID=A0A1F6VJ93_9BACT|nr:MAG: 2'-5' RNA ligase [Candidatus Nomurabacteria bacterium RIFCSPHIGHO2_01_FULL_42_16]OGI92589.1 MAG: 2'-5' RNA ligase [Candidatus Nomurabacteria bacterium RIFCSPLOWO2_01_FULL_42_20]